MIGQIQEVCETLFQELNLDWTVNRQCLIRSAIDAERIFLLWNDFGRLEAVVIWVRANISSAIVGVNLDELEHSETGSDLVVTDVYKREEISFQILFDQLREQLSPKFKSGYNIAQKSGYITGISKLWDSDYKLVTENLERLLSEGFSEINAKTGCVQFRFLDAPSFEFSLKINYIGCEINSENDCNSDAQITCELSDISCLLYENTTVDLRSSRFLNLMHGEGDLSLCFEVLQSLLRPTRKTLARFAAARALPIIQSPIERLSLRDQQQVLDGIASQIPFIIEDIKEVWPHSDSGLEDLTKNFGEIDFAYESKITLAQVIAKICDPEDEYYYTGGVRLPPELDAVFPPVVDTTYGLIPPQLWMGKANNPERPVTELHRDNTDGFLGQVIGSKKLYLFHPSDEKFLYPKTGYNNYQQCKVQHFNPDKKLFPLYKKANPLEIILRPGELLYQPAGWFHCVYALDKEFTMSVSYFESRE